MKKDKAHKDIYITFGSPEFFEWFIDDSLKLHNRDDPVRHPSGLKIKKVKEHIEGEPIFLDHGSICVDRIESDVEIDFVQLLDWLKDKEIIKDYNLDPVKDYL